MRRDCGYALRFVPAVPDLAVTTPAMARCGKPLAVPDRLDAADVAEALDTDDVTAPDVAAAVMAAADVSEAMAETAVGEVMKPTTVAEAVPAMSAATVAVAETTEPPGVMRERKPAATEAKAKAAMAAAEAGRTHVHDARCARLVYRDRAREVHAAMVGPRRRKCRQRDRADGTLHSAVMAAAAMVAETASVEATMMRMRASVATTCSCDHDGAHIMTEVRTAELAHIDFHPVAAQLAHEAAMPATVMATCHEAAAMAAADDNTATAASMSPHRGKATAKATAMSTHRREPSTVPAHRREPAAVPAHRSEAATMPTHRREAASVPAHGCKPAAVPTHRGEAATVPAHRCKPAAVPTAHRHSAATCAGFDHGGICGRQRRLQAVRQSCSGQGVGHLRRQPHDQQSAQQGQKSTLTHHTSPLSALCWMPGPKNLRTDQFLRGLVRAPTESLILAHANCNRRFHRRFIIRCTISQLELRADMSLLDPFEIEQ